MRRLFPAVLAEGLIDRPPLDAVATDVTARGRLAGWPT